MIFSLTQKSPLHAIPAETLADWFVTCSYDISGTDTYRLASDPLLKGFNKGALGPLEVGGNLQNFAKDWRKYFYAPEGYSLLQTDQDGAEARIVAYECEPGKYRELFVHGVKPHVFIALHNFAEQLKKLFPELAETINECKLLPIAELKKHPRWKELDKAIKSTDNLTASLRYYYIAKMICHASNYGMTAYAFQLNVLEKSQGQINLTLLECEIYLENYHKLFPEIRRWHRVIINKLRVDATLCNLFGHPRVFTDYLDFSKDLKDAYSFIPQSTVGVITHRAVTSLQQYIELNGLAWNLLTNTHDSYLCSAPDTDKVECAKIMRQFMNQELTSNRGDKFFMKSETAVGKNWGAYKKELNEEGLVTLD